MISTGLGLLPGQLEEDQQRTRRDPYNLCFVNLWRKRCWHFNRTLLTRPSEHHIWDDRGSRRIFQSARLLPRHAKLSAKICLRKKKVVRVLSPHSDLSHSHGHTLSDVELGQVAVGWLYRRIWQVVTISIRTGHVHCGQRFDWVWTCVLTEVLQEFLCV